MMNEIRAEYGDEEKAMLDMTKTKLMEARKKDLEAGIITLNDEFTRLTMEEILRDLDALDANANIKVVTIRINSHGGNVSALLPLVARIERMKKPVATEVLGMAYSCGAMLLLSGTHGHRRAGKYSDILLHEVSGSFSYGKSSQQRLNAEYLTRLNTLFRKIIKEKTKMMEKDLVKYMDSNTDIFIDAPTALRYGIIDTIL